MPTLKVIRRRIGSVKSTQQITRAMKLVAAARLRRAQEALLNARPYREALTRAADSVLRTERGGPAQAQAAALIVVIASDRGLCGAYNINLLRRAEEQGRRAREAGLTPQFFAVGRKAAEHFKRAGIALAGERTNHPRLASIGLARGLAQQILAAYRADEVSAAGVVYSRFQSALAQRPAYERLLPIPPPEVKEGAGPAAEEPAAQELTEYLFEPSREQLVPLVLRIYLESAVFHALLEAEASEQGARMTAMDNATRNAGDMIKRLTLVYNRSRQANITRELIEIISGAEAV